MKRIELFEFEDFIWFPEVIRTCMTNLIVVLHKILNTSEVLVGLLENVQKHHEFSKVIDLGSGSGGAMPEVIKLINEKKDEPIQLILTDLYPNSKCIHKINNGSLKNVVYKETSINATNLDKTPKGLKTMVNSFHHMPPAQAKKILKSAQENKEPILIYEMGENFVPTLIWWLFLPVSLLILFVMSLFMTPFVRPLTWQQIVFTYFIPIIPICYAWDGQASTMRTYTFKDVGYLLQDIEDEDYTWKIESAKKKNGKKLGYYILGLPK
ncbi:hypothetical protein AWE51_15500 [Aquimarina aggregata]|uniref:Class I SAM-dependent methyltransferase n=1 Tax=Aquimarina aggregata TaxID=1642818 RepID=A0A162CVG7_9FLAO|nr:hypothetical protein [Aquimarina aggregata]KZS42774.1 hypothetical protein AWE51_15500 [Aquimarina aggregata]